MGGSTNFGDIFDRLSDVYGRYLDYQTSNRLINSFGQVNGRRVTGIGPNGEYLYASSSSDMSSLLPILLVGGLIIGGVVLLSRA